MNIDMNPYRFFLITKCHEQFLHYFFINVTTFDKEAIIFLVRVIDRMKQNELITLFNHKQLQLIQTFSQMKVFNCETLKVKNKNIDNKSIRCTYIRYPIELGSTV